MDIDLLVNKEEQEMSNLIDYESFIKKISDDNLLNLFASLSYEDIENPSLKNNAKWDIVKAELLSRMK